MSTHCVARQINPNAVCAVVAAFDVHVTIENKLGISDPEGETILNDLVLKEGTNKNVTKIKTAKMLKFVIVEQDAESAKSAVLKICDDLRIYNPMVSKISVVCHEFDALAL